MNTLNEHNALSQMINDLAEHILCTREYRTTIDPQGPERIERKPLQIEGRYVSNDHKLYITRSAVRRWRIANRIPDETLIEFAKQNKLLLFGSAYVELTRGTILPAAALDVHGV